MSRSRRRDFAPDDSPGTGPEARPGDAAPGPEVETVFELEAVIRGTEPPVRRLLLVEGETPLDHLHDILQIAFGWQDCHLHQFVAPDGTKYAHPDFELDWAEDESHYMLRDLLARPGDTCTYEYDFGDDWRHDLRLRRIVPLPASEECPICLDGERACPPEDCGGIPGYLALLDGNAAASGFDPDAFDADAVNRALRERG